MITQLYWLTACIPKQFLLNSFTTNTAIQQFYNYQHRPEGFLEFETDENDRFQLAHTREISIT
jgi:hypothetical protein